MLCILLVYVTTIRFRRRGKTDIRKSACARKATGEDSECKYCTLGKRKGNDLVACVEKKRPRVVANVEFTLRQCEAAGLDQHPELSFESQGHRHTLSGNCVLTCTRHDVYEHPPLGLVRQGKIVLDERGDYNAGCPSVFPMLSRVASCLGLAGSCRLLFTC